MKAVKKLIKQINSCGDVKSANILETIEEEEVDHYSNGIKWFQYLVKEMKMTLE